MTTVGTSSYYPAAGGYATKERSAGTSDPTPVDNGAGKPAPNTVTLEVPSDYTPKTFAGSFMGMALNFTRGIDTPGMKMTLPADISVEELTALSKNFETEMEASPQPTSAPDTETAGTTDVSAQAEFDTTHDWQQHPIYLQLQELIRQRRAAE